jgi:hypothetical protein
MNAGWLLVGVATAMGSAALMAASGAAASGKSQDRKWDQDRDYSFNIQTPRHGEPLTSCNDLDVKLRRGELARDEEVQNIPASAQGLAVSGARNGPVFVIGTDRNDYQISLCKFTAGATADEARARLANLSLTVANGRVTVKGPQENGYAAYLLVETPREARLNVDTTNGPLALRSLSGHITARTLNGPLSVEDVSGEVDVQAQNGPLSVHNGSGRMRATTENGPLSVVLSGTDWQGTGLDASTQNGPLHLALPEGYRSGVQVDITGNGPFNCSNSACRGAQGNWDDRGRRLHLGSDPTPTVRVTAGNGPVSIGSEKED